jgi:hypothetical protein
MSRATWMALTAAGMFLLIAVGLAGGYFLILHAISHSTSQWCDTLRLLTAHKVPYPASPSKNPSRLEAYNLYEDFSRLKVKFGC